MSLKSAVSRLRRFFGGSSGSSNAISFNNATFFAPLTQSVKDITETKFGTRTRASTAMVECWDGHFETAEINEIRQKGIRRERNVFPKSEDFSDATWLKGGGTTVTGTPGNQTISLPTAGSSYIVYQPGAVWGSTVGGESLTAGFKLKADQASNIGKTVTLWVQFYSTTVKFTQQVTLEENEQYYGVSGQTTTAGQQYYYWGIERAAGDTATGLICTGAMGTVSTGKPNKVAPEYVSRGVLSAPYEHGIDGVDYFVTENNNTIDPATGKVLQKAGKAIHRDWQKGAFGEESRTNKCLRGNEFDHAQWTKTNITVTANDTYSIDGRKNADLLTATGANGTCLNSLTATAAYETFGCYVKPNVLNGSISVSPDGVTWEDVTDRIKAGEFVHVWSRKVLTAGTVTPGIKLSNSGDSVWVCYAQHEIGAGPSSPIEVTNTPVTRSTDSALTYTAPAGISFADGFILSAQISAEQVHQISSIGSIIEVGDNWNNKLFIYLDSTTTPNMITCGVYHPTYGLQSRVGTFNWDGLMDANIVVGLTSTGYKIAVNGFAIDYSGFNEANGVYAPTGTPKIYINPGYSMAVKNLAMWSGSSFPVTWENILAVSSPDVEETHFLEGDSITDTSNDINAVDRQLYRMMGYPKNVILVTHALGNSQVGSRGGGSMSLKPSMIDRGPWLDIVIKNSKSKVVTIDYMCGVNDKLTGKTEAEIVQFMKDYNAARKLANPRVRIGMESNIQSGTGTFRTIMDGLLATAFGDGSLKADVLTYLGRDTRMTDATNLTYFNADQIHLTHVVGWFVFAYYKLLTLLKLRADF